MQKILEPLLALVGVIASVWLTVYFLHIVGDSWQVFPITFTGFVVLCYFTRVLCSVDDV